MVGKGGSGGGRVSVWGYRCAGAPPPSFPCLSPAFLPAVQAGRVSLDDGRQQSLVALPEIQHLSVLQPVRAPAAAAAATQALRLPQQVEDDHDPGLCGVGGTWGGGWFVSVVGRQKRAPCGRQCCGFVPRCLLGTGPGRGGCLPAARP